jgi:hypothetical protein
MTADCSSVSVNGLLSQNFTGGGTSFYSCAFPSNYTLASKCCSPDTVHPFPIDPCYSWCDLPASMDAAFDADDVDYYQYFQGCLNTTGEETGPLWCHAQPHVIRPTAITTKAAPTSTFDAVAWCATQNPQELISVPGPKPACGILPNQSNSDALVKCCQPAPAQWSVMHCYEYCGLPQGTGFRGVGNLTYDETLGSFKACLLQEGNGSQSVFDGVYCRTNGMPIDLRSTTFGTTKYLTGMAGRFGVGRGFWLLLVAFGFKFCFTYG